MSNYFTRPGGAYIKIDPSTEIVDLILNVDTQKTYSSIDDPTYYNNTVSASASWPTLNETDYNTAKTTVLAYLNSL
jgi:hypothetical protein